MKKFHASAIIGILLMIFYYPSIAQQSLTPYQSATSPQIFAPAIISTGDYETHAAFTPSGDTVFFLKGAPDFSTWTICISYFKNGKWSLPVVAPFSGKYMDADPFVTKDGKEVYFISNRPVNPGDSTKSDEDIWKVILTKSGWSAPIHLDAPVNTNYDEYYPTISDDGTLYFGSERSGGKGNCDVYSAAWLNGSFQQPINLGDSINGPDNEYEPFIFPDNNTLIFMATRPNGLKNGDFYISHRVNGTWSLAKKLPAPFNSTATEWAPKLTRDGKYFYFGSTRNRTTGLPAKPETIFLLNARIRSAGNGLGDIYIIRVGDQFK